MSRKVVEKTVDVGERWNSPAVAALDQRRVPRDDVLVLVEVPLNLALLDLVEILRE